MLLVMTLITVAQTAWAETFNTSYMDVDGSTKYVDATVLTGEETNLQAGWYVAVGNINYTKRLSIAGDVHLILADGCQMNIGTSENRLNTDGLTYITSKGAKYSLTIYGQSTGSDMGLLSVWVTGDRKNGIHISYLTINGGHIVSSTDGDSAYPIFSNLSNKGNITINGGFVETIAPNAVGIVSVKYLFINGGTLSADARRAILCLGDVNLNGGTVNAIGSSGIGDIYSNNGNIYLAGSTVTTHGYTFGNTGGSVIVATGLRYNDGTNYYDGTLTSDVIATLVDKTLSCTTNLANDADNSTRIAAAHGIGSLDVKLCDRTLTKDGTWNTLCLPFSLSEEQIAKSPLAGAVIKEMDESTSLSDGLLTLKFKEATSIEAGKAYIVKWTTTGENIVNPVFYGVTVGNTAPVETVSTDGKVKFVGQYSPFAIDDNNINEILFIGSGNKIGYSKNPRSLKSCRAHFWVKPNGNSASARVINLDLGDGVTTRIDLVNAEEDSNSKSGMYTLDGRKVQGEPKKGVYITKGKKVVK